MFDLIIIGGGPAGLTAALYACRYKLKTALVAEKIGGTGLEAIKVENFPGIEAITGIKLMKKMEEQIKSYDVKVFQEQVKNIKKHCETFNVILGKETLSGKTLILALGSERRRLNVPGEKEFLGRGVSYCATCDAAFFRNKTVAVIGGSYAAVCSAQLLSEYAKKIYIIYRKNKLRGDPINVEKLEKNPKITIIYNTNITEIKGDKFVEKIILDKFFENKKELRLEGVFIEIGSIPKSELASNLQVARNERREIITDKAMQTNISGVFAAGDVTNSTLRQIITACGEGAIAAASSYKYLNNIDILSYI